MLSLTNTHWSRQSQKNRLCEYAFDWYQAIHNYLNAIITAGIDCDGVIKLPTTGIPCGSALSPFFGALYLKPLDQAFENKENCLYLRYMDDILILVKTKRQYQRAKKQVFKILRKGLLQNKLYS